MRVIRTRTEEILLGIGSSTEIKEPLEGSYIYMNVLLRTGNKAIVRIIGQDGSILNEFYMDSRTQRIRYYIQMPQTLAYWPTMTVQIETPPDALLDSNVIINITQGEAY